MAEPTDSTETRKHFLDVQDAEIVHGPDVIAEKVSGALKDADRFDVPRVKRPLSQALDKLRRSGASDAVGEPAEQDALSGAPAAVDETAGSAERLKPDREAGAA